MTNGSATSGSRMPKSDKPNKYDQLLEDVKKKGPAAISQWRNSHAANVDILTPDEFFKKLNGAVQSPAAKFFQDVKEGKATVDPRSTIVEYCLKTNEWRFRKVKNTPDLVKLMEQSKSAEKEMGRLREARMQQFLRKKKLIEARKRNKEDSFDPLFDLDGSDATVTNTTSDGYEIKHEYTPLLGTPFFKQMYLYDMLLMHSKTFWYKNYSGPAKLCMQIYRNFVIGEGFSITCDDDKAVKAWEAYEERSQIHEKIGTWHDEAFFAGELMLEKKFTPAGMVHESIDVSTIWEIVTDPENISDIKYYHQQYPTQYQIYGTKDTPISKYVIRQIPPELVHHIKFNVTSWEKRGRSDLLAALLYLKYFDDYIGFKLQRTKAEAAYFWDVVIKGDASDVANYISTTQSIVDVAPGSENVHNEAVDRKTIMPSLSHVGSDDVAKWILSYIFMSQGIPTSYAGTLESVGSSRANALVSTEPVTKLMEERRKKFEWMLHRIWKDVMIDAGLDPETEVEFNFPELTVEDRSKKLADVYLAFTEQTISHETASNIVAQELNITTYDYEKEQEKIKEELAANPSLLNPEMGLTQDGKPDDTTGSHAFDRDSARDDNTQPL